MSLTNLQRDLIFGTLLGDANLQTATNGRTWRYRAIHKSEHKEYLFHKYDILKSLCGPDTVPVEGNTFDERTSNTSYRWYFNTLTNPSLNFFGNMFYTYDSAKPGQWKKDVPINVSKFLTPPALAYFYMDDGALKWLGHSNAMRICTESFSHDGVKRLQNVFQNKYGISTTLTKKTLNDGSIGYRIAIPEKSSKAFCELIQPYLVDCMKYKVSDGKKGHL